MLWPPTHTKVPKVNLSINTTCPLPGQISQARRKVGRAAKTVTINVHRFTRRNAFLQLCKRPYSAQLQNYVNQLDGTALTTLGLWNLKDVAQQLDQLSHKV